MDDHPYYLRQRPNVFPVALVFTLSFTSITTPLVSSNTVCSGPTQLSTLVINNVRLLHDAADTHASCLGLYQ